jgi:hypothetical protein
MPQHSCCQSRAQQLLATHQGWLQERPVPPIHVETCPLDSSPAVCSTRWPAAMPPCLPFAATRVTKKAGPWLLLRPPAPCCPGRRHPPPPPNASSSSCWAFAPAPAPVHAASVAPQPPAAALPLPARSCRLPPVAAAAILPPSCGQCGVRTLALLPSSRQCGVHTAICLQQSMSAPFHLLSPSPPQAAPPALKRPVWRSRPPGTVPVPALRLLSPSCAQAASVA